MDPLYGRSPLNQPEAEGSRCRVIVADREKGYSLVDREAEPHFRSASVPIRRYDGSIIAAINMGAHVDRVSTAEMVERFLPLLREGAESVKSMLLSFHNFFFVSSDPGGLVTIDKTPLGLWLQTLSAAIFGFHPLSLLLPEALCAIAAVAVVYLIATEAHTSAATIHELMASKARAAAVSADVSADRMAEA